MIDAAEMNPSTKQVERNRSTRLREFRDVHINEDCSEASGLHEDELFYECVFRDLTDLTLKDCDLNGSRFTTDKLREALGFTMTLGCHSFTDVEFSPLLFDLFLCMAYLSKGNDEKREKLLDVIGRERASTLLRRLKGID